MPVVIPPELIPHLARAAWETPANGEEPPRTHVRVGPGGVPEPVARDLRHVRDDAWGTVWASPRWRAILLAAQGGGELVFYARQADYANAVRDARVGRLPEIPPPQMPERDWAR